MLLPYVALIASILWAAISRCVARLGCTPSRLKKSPNGASQHPAPAAFGKSGTCPAVRGESSTGFGSRCQPVRIAGRIEIRQNVDDGCARNCRIVDERRHRSHPPVSIRSIMHRKMKAEDLLSIILGPPSSHIVNPLKLLCSERLHPVANRVGSPRSDVGLHL